MLSSAAAILAGQEAMRYAVLLRVATLTPLRLWSGPGLLTTSVDDALDPSASYYGAGMINALPPFRQLIGGVAERIDIGFSGVDAVTQGWIDDEASDIIGSEVNIGLRFMGDDFQSVDTVAWLASYTVDTATSKYSGMTETVTLSCSSEFTDRTLAAPRFWSDAGHRARHPGDDMCSLMSALNEGITVTWPGI